MAYTLVGKVLVLDTPDGKRYTTSRFKAQLSEKLYLMQVLDPETGKPFPGDFKYILNLETLPVVPSEDYAWTRAKIFETEVQARRFFQRPEPATDEAVDEAPGRLVNVLKSVLHGDSKE